MDIHQVIGRNIKEIRRRNHITQENLACFCGISTSHLSAIESGRQNPTVSILEKIALNLNTTVQRLLEEEMKKDDPNDTYNLSQYQNIFNALPDTKKETVMKIMNILLNDEIV